MGWDGIGSDRIGRFFEIFDRAASQIVSVTGSSATALNVRLSRRQVEKLSDVGDPLKLSIQVFRSITLSLIIMGQTAPTPKMQPARTRDQQ